MLNTDTIMDARDKAERAAPPVRIIYSSRTGNTRSVAEHLALRFGISAVNAKEELAARQAEAGLPSQGDAAGADDTDLYLLGGIDNAFLSAFLFEKIQAQFACHNNSP